MKIKLVYFFLLIFLIDFASAVHYIEGFVNNASSGEGANGKTIFLWNPSVGTSDNLTDIIGPSGNSGIDNYYRIDCDLLSNPCNKDDILSLKVINNGDNYVSSEISVIVTKTSPDIAGNLTLNSIPSPSINFPSNNTLTNNGTIFINCSFYDADSGGGNISIYGNFSGAWGKVETKEVTFNSAKIFNISVNEGAYKYSCSAKDSLLEIFSENRTLYVDLTKPLVSIFLNQTSSCGNTSLRVSCNTTDTNGIKNVTIEKTSFGSSENFSASYLSGNIYYKDFFLSTGIFNFTCYSFDNASNLNSNKSDPFYVYSDFPELSVDSKDISFSNYFPIEKENVTIDFLIYNKGCVSSSSFLVELLEGDPDSGKLIDSKYLEVQNLSSVSSNFNFLSLLGKSNFFIVLDRNNALNETNMSDNIANKTFEVLSWQEFYGNITSTKILQANISDFGIWGNFTNLQGNVFMVDKESQINWMNLIAFGKNKLNETSSNDFSEIDGLLNMTNFSDSVSNKYNNSNFSNFIINNKEISSVPIIQSTNNSNFMTGILWDSSDDSDGEFSLFDKEDIVFVSAINKSTFGKYGTYDYEIKVPAKLREYYSNDTNEIYFYYELI